MKYCKKCKIEISSTFYKCPLCHSVLKKTKGFMDLIKHHEDKTKTH